MEEKKQSKITLGTAIFLIVITILAIIFLLVYVYQFNNKNEEVTINNIAGLNKTSNESINNNSNANNSNVTNITNTATINNTNTSVQTNNDVTYNIKQKDDIHFTINATKNGKTISKDCEADAQIYKTDTNAEIPNIGKVLLIATSGGEYTGVQVYKLVENEIKDLGVIDCGASMVKEATYTVSKTGEGTAIINSTRNGKTTTKEVEMNAAIANINVVDILDFGKVVLIAETGGEYYGIVAYRLTQDYITGKTEDIQNVGTLNAY